MMHGVFVTGTDTGVGKTLAACALIHALRRAGRSVAAMKPVAAGATGNGGSLLNEDTEAMLRALGWGRDRAATVTPMLLREPIAPHIAARIEGRRIDISALAAACSNLAATSESIVVEGVGGFRVPLGDDTDTVDLARALALPVVMVVGLRLGCLNHALLTAQAIAAAGLRLAGWIANAIDPSMPYRDENIEALRARLAAPWMGTIAFMSMPDALAASHELRIDALIEP